MKGEYDAWLVDDTGLMTTRKASTGSPAACTLTIAPDEAARAAFPMSRTRRVF